MCSYLFLDTGDELLPIHIQGQDLRENGVRPSLYDAAVSWLRLQTPIDCIPHPYWMYTKCFSTLTCCGWAYGCILIAVLHVQVGVNFRKHGVWPSLYDVAMSWLRLQTPIDCISHPYWMYTECFSSLRCCGWAYGCNLSMPYYIVQVGMNFRKNGVWPSLYVVAVSWLRLQTPKDCIPHPFLMYTQCFSTLTCCGWAYGCTLTMPYYIVQVGVKFRKHGV